MNQQSFEAELTKRDAVIAKLKDALEWYAKRNNWMPFDYSFDVKDCVHVSDLGVKSYTSDSDYSLPSGGRRAREALTSITEIERGDEPKENKE